MSFLTICSFILLLLEQHNVLPTSFDEVKDDCEQVNASDSMLCLSSFANTGVIAIHRKDVSTLPVDGMIARIVSTSVGDSNVTLVGGSVRDYHWIGFSISDVARGSMGRGGPTLVCAHHRVDSVVRVYFLGTSSQVDLLMTSFEEAAATYPATIGSTSESDYFTNFSTQEEHILGTKYIVCEFKITQRMWKLDFTEMDLTTRPFNVAFAQGRILDEEHILGVEETLEPAAHHSNARFVSRAKYFLHRPGSNQSHIIEYLGCGVTDYCVGVGRDSCGSVSFDCLYFAKFVRRGNSTIGVTLHGAGLASFVGIGFSSASNILAEHKRGLQFISICEVGGTPTVLRVNCRQNNEFDPKSCEQSNDHPGEPRVIVTSPILQTPFVTSRDTTVVVISCKFDLEFSGDDLEMMKQLGTRVFVGGESRGSAEWLNVLRVTNPNDSTAFFTTNDNSALLKEGENSLPPKLAWELLKFERLANYPDPAGLDPRVNKGFMQTQAIKSVLLMVVFHILSFFPEKL